MSALRVLLVCSGLEHARRGYESFARECFEALRDERAIQLELVKGSGAADRGEHVARALRRDRRPARVLGRALGARPFRLEALSFALTLQPLIARLRPDVVYVSEWDTARGLARVRSLARQRFKLLLCNGGMAASGFAHFDHVQELTPAAREYVLARGAHPSRHSVLPLGFDIPAQLTRLSPEDRRALRRRLGLPDDRPLVLSAAALNRSHKRLDYLIEELAAVSAPRPFLLMAGEPDDETPEIGALARARLGPEGFAIRTVPTGEMPDLYRASDVFVLASLVEMQGRALIEAAGHGVPCIAHDSPVMTFALGESGVYADFTQPGALTALLARPALPDGDARRAAGIHWHVYERFSWARLRARYVELFVRVASQNSTVSSSTGE